MNKSALIDLLHGLIAIDTTSGRTEAQRQLQAHVAARLIEQDSRLGALTSSSTTGFPWALVYTKAQGTYLVFAFTLILSPLETKANGTTRLSLPSPPTGMSTVVEGQT